MFLVLAATGEKADLMKRKLGETFVATRVHLRAQFACRRKLGTSHLLNGRSDRSSKSRYPGSDLIINKKRKTIRECENIVISSRCFYDYKKVTVINGRK